MLADNSSHLRAVARAKHEATRRRALAALAKLETDGMHVTVTALATAAGVARSWIYTQPDLMDRISAAPEGAAKPRADSHVRRIVAAPARTGPPKNQGPHRGEQATPHPTGSCTRPAPR
ncbi:MAG TPA: DUF6262 family protein [Mycobacterium sp.]|nr:DUF6262 family protein [Mycobacterium sp.]